MPSPYLEKSKPWIVQGVLILSIALVSWFGIRPLYNIIRSEMDEIQKVNVLQEHRGNQLKKLPELERQYEFIQSNGDRLDILISKDELVGFIRTLEDLAEREQVRIEITAKDNTLLESKTTPLVDPKTNKKGVADDNDTAASSREKDKKDTAKSVTGIMGDIAFKKYIRLAVTVVAPYQSMLNYLHKLETLPYALDVVGITAKEYIADTVIDPTKHQVVAGESQAEANAPGSSSPQPVMLETTFEVAVYIKE